jgi:hypothetical protein
MLQAALHEDPLSRLQRIRDMYNTGSAPGQLPFTAARNRRSLGQSLVCLHLLSPKTAADHFLAFVYQIGR